MPDPASTEPILDIDIAFSQWLSLLDASIDEIHQAVKIVIDRVIDEKKQFEVSLVFTDDAAIQKLNKEYRGKDKPTNVLSFPQIEDISTIKDLSSPVMLGDIVLAWETVSWEAADQEKILAHHMIHLIVHGMMHLFGFDHIEDPEADKMEKIEIDILRQLNIPNPYV